MPNFTYTRDTPFSTHNPSTDQPDMLINTNSTDDLIAVDHYSFNDNDGGYHKQSTYPTLVSANPTTTSTQGAIYTNTVVDPVLGTNIELFYIHRNSNRIVQMTSNLVPFVSGGGEGYTFLPGGFLLMWGNFDPNSSINVSFPFSFNNVFNVQLTGSADNNSTFRNGISTGSLSTSGFTWEGTVSSHWTPIYWMAIGN